MKIVQTGSKVKIEYEGRLDDGIIFDSSIGKDPLEVTVGEGMLIPGFEDALLGMQQGEKKEIRIVPQDAYGPVHPQLIQKVPRTALPKGSEPKPGMMITLKNQNTGQTVPARISEVSADSITIDLNHPLAGKALNFKIKILEIG